MTYYTLPWTYIPTSSGGTPARWSREFIRAQGVNLAYGYGPSSDISTVPIIGDMLDYLADGLPGQQIGRVRVGKVVEGAARQRACVTLAADRGIGVTAQVRDGGLPTPKSCALEMLTGWKATDGTPAVVDMFELQNEPNLEPGSAYIGLKTWAALTTQPFTDRTKTANLLPPLELRYSAGLAYALRNDPDITAALAGRSLPRLCSPQFAGMGESTWNAEWSNRVGLSWQTRWDTSVGNPAGLALADMFDVAGVHQYPSASIPSNGDLPAKQLADARSIYGTIPAILGETGYYRTPAGVSPPLSGAVDETTFAKYVPRLFIDNFAVGYDMVNIYCLPDTPQRTQLDEKSRGVFQVDGTPYPAGTAWRNMNRHFADAATSYTPQDLPGPVTAPAGLAWSVWQRSDGTWVMPLSQPAKAAGASGSLNLSVALDRARTVTVYKPSTSASPQSTTTTATPTIAVGDEAVIVTIA